MADLFGDLFDGGVPRKPKPEKGVQLRGQRIQGVQYVRLEDVVELLKVNDVLPQLQKQLQRKVDP